MFWYELIYAAAKICQDVPIVHAFKSLLIYCPLKSEPDIEHFSIQGMKGWQVLKGLSNVNSSQIVGGFEG